MELEKYLQNQYLNITHILQNYKKEELKNELVKILTSDFVKLTENRIYFSNFISMLSYVYASEQLKKMSADKALSVSGFDEEFKKKLQKLKEKVNEKQSPLLA